MATNSDVLHALLTTILGAFKDPTHALTGDGPPDSWTAYGHLPQKVLGLVGQLGDIPGGVDYLSANDAAKLKATLSNEIALQEKQAEAVLHAQMQLLQTIVSATVEAVSEVAEALATGLEEQEPDEDPAQPSSDDGPEEDAPEPGEEAGPPSDEGEPAEDAPAPLGTPQEKDDGEAAGLLAPTHGYGTEGTPSGPETTTPTPDAPKPSDPGPTTVGDPTSATPGVASVTGPAETVEWPAKDGEDDKGEGATSSDEESVDKLGPISAGEGIPSDSSPDATESTSSTPPTSTEEDGPEQTEPAAGGADKPLDAPADPTPAGDSPLSGTEATTTPADETPAARPTDGTTTTTDSAGANGADEKKEPTVEASGPFDAPVATESSDPQAPVDPTATPEPAGQSPR